MSGGMALWYLGRHDQALELMGQALAATEKLGHLFSRAYVLTWAAILHVHRRDVAKAQQAVELALVFAAEHGFPYWHAQAVLLQGWVLVQRGLLASGIERLREGLAAIQATGSEILQPWAMGLLAEAYCTADRLADGNTLIEEALAVVARTSQRWCEAELYRLKGEFMLALSDPSGAEIYLRRALDVARRQDAKTWELRAAVSLARLWRAQGLGSRARELLAPLVGSSSQGSSTPDLQDARAVLTSSED